MARTEISRGALDEALFCILWSDFQADEVENLWTDQRAAPKHFSSPIGISGMAANTKNSKKILGHQTRERQEHDFLSVSRGL